MTWLQQCDLFLAEVSGSSFGLGFEAGYLPGATAKKVLLFYRLELKEKISLLITGNTHSKCTLMPYSSTAEVQTFIKINLRLGAPQAGDSGGANPRDPRPMGWAEQRVHHGVSAQGDRLQPYVGSSQTAAPCVSSSGRYNPTVSISVAAGSPQFGHVGFWGHPASLPERISERRTPSTQDSQA
ncbi:MAG: hypothetical protein ABSB82_22625 [Terriglobia bacterium]|jgi:hypothetical protein